MNTSPHQPLRPRPEQADARSSDELVERFLEMEISEADEGLTERALVEMLARESAERPSRCFAGNVIRCLESEERAASCWSPRAVLTAVVSVIVLCGSGVLLLARLAGLPTAPGLEWLPIFRAAWSAAISAPSALASGLAQFGGSWADARSAVEWAYSPELLLLSGVALCIATLALGALARLMKSRDLESVEVEAVG